METINYSDLKQVGLVKSFEPITGNMCVKLDADTQLYLMPQIWKLQKIHIEKHIKANNLILFAKVDEYGNEIFIFRHKPKWHS